ncbi:hypothetical protein [Levilactobacillus yonginensis]|uniref:hypothetical protein n=1 Tax=Levilactobacillus yonginensis TaxID=1054041 RepID=UPI00345CDED6
MLAISAVALGGGLLAKAQTEKPSALVKVGDYTASTDFLNLSAYYKTTKPVTVKVAYLPTYKAGQAIMQKLTLPAGITVAGNLTTTKKGSYLVPSLQLYLARLSYPALLNSAKAGYTMDPGAGAYDPQASITSTEKLAGFKRVKAPIYMPGYSHGDLYIGGAKAALSPIEPHTTSLRITPDGYVEVLKYDNKANSGLGFAQKPYSIAKITKTSFNDPYRKLYFSHDLKGVNTKRVSHSGTYQYCLTLKNLHTPQHTTGNPTKGTAGTFDSLYTIGGTKYYTFIGYDGVSD